MKIMRTLLMRAFGRPRGLLGRLGGMIMARMNRDCGVWVADLLEVRPGERVMEVGFGPGVGIQHLSRLIPALQVAGVDASLEMVEQAQTRNAEAIRTGQVDLRHASAERLPFESGSFDKALAI